MNARANQPDSRPRRSLVEAMRLQSTSSSTADRPKGPSPAQLLPVANAGACLLWPLLPPLWRQLQILGDRGFFDAQAQHNAVCWLDEIVWGTRPLDVARLAFTQLMCSLPPDTPLSPPPERADVKAVLEGFVASLPSRSPAWQALSAEEIRRLFLQRSGWVAGEHGSHALYLEPQPHDTLLDGMPWPFETMRLPWIDQPWSVHWSLPPCLMPCLMPAAHSPDRRDHKTTCSGSFGDPATRLPLR